MRAPDRSVRMLLDALTKNLDASIALVKSLGAGDSQSLDSGPASSHAPVSKDMSPVASFSRAGGGAS